MNDELLFVYEFKTKLGYGKMFSNGLNYDNLKKKYNITKVYTVEIINGNLQYIDVSEEVIDG